jgi:crotonobetaine/carnitine-CoA ligase
MTEIGLVSMSSFEPSHGSGVGEAWEVRIGDDVDDEVRRGEIGEILVRPREAGTLFHGYYGRPDATVEVTRNLWFHTGDLGRMDAEGRLAFVGRKKDMIRRRGHNISTWEIEEIVGSHDAVAECVAVGVPATLGEEDVLVAVVPRADAELDPDRLRAFCAERMAPYMVPDHVRVVAEIPTTSTGKPAKAELAALVAGGQATGAN